MSMTYFKKGISIMTNIAKTALRIAKQMEEERYAKATEMILEKMQEWMEQKVKAYSFWEAEEVVPVDVFDQVRSMSVIKSGDIENILSNLGFGVTQNRRNYVCKVPLSIEKGARKTVAQKMVLEANREVARKSKEAKQEARDIGNLIFSRIQQMEFTSRKLYEGTYKITINGLALPDNKVFENEIKNILEEKGFQEIVVSPSQCYIEFFVVEK